MAEWKVCVIKCSGSKLFYLIWCYFDAEAHILSWHVVGSIEGMVHL